MQLLDVYNFHVVPPFLVEAVIPSLLSLNSLSSLISITLYHRIFDSYSSSQLQCSPSLSFSAQASQPSQPLIQFLKLFQPPSIQLPSPPNLLPSPHPWDHYPAE
jgi:hypothetical protein